MIARPFRNFRRSVSTQQIALLFVTQAYSRARNYCTGLSPAGYRFLGTHVSGSFMGCFLQLDWYTYRLHIEYRHIHKFNMKKLSNSSIILYKPSE